MAHSCYFWAILYPNATTLAYPDHWARLCNIFQFHPIINPRTELLNLENQHEAWKYASMQFVYFNPSVSKFTNEMELLIMSV